MHLTVEVIQVFIEVAGLPFEGFVISHRVKRVALGRVMRVMPVELGVIQSDLESFCAESINLFPHQIAPGCGVGGLVIGDS